MLFFISAAREEEIAKEDGGQRVRINVVPLEREKVVKCCRAESNTKVGIVASCQFRNDCIVECHH